MYGWELIDVLSRRDWQHRCPDGALVDVEDRPFVSRGHQHDRRSRDHHHHHHDFIGLVDDCARSLVGQRATHLTTIERPNDHRPHVDHGEIHTHHTPPRATEHPDHPTPSMNLPTAV